MFKNFQFDRFELDNGLILLVHQNPRIPLVSLNAFVTCGKDQNAPNSPGMASLTARMLDEGTENYTSTELSKALEAIGAEMTSFSERELTALTLQSHTQHLPLTLEILAEMMTRPTFPAERLKEERLKVITHIAAMADDPQIVGSQILNQHVYADTPIAAPVLGFPETLADFTSGDLQAFHARTYSPSNTILIVSGDFETSHLENLVRTHFEGWTNPSFAPVSRWSLARQTAPVEVSAAMDKEQLHIYIGHLGTVRKNPDHYSLQVLDVILGGGPGFTSRIPKRMREDEGLAYVAYADISGSSGIYPGRFIAYVGTSPGNSDRVLEELRSEIRCIQAEGVTEEELEMAKHFLTGSFVFEFQSNTSVSKSLLSIELFELGDDHINTYPHRISEVTREDVVRVAREYLDTVNFTTVLVGSI